MTTMDVKPTRSELLSVKKKIAISTSGHKLLKMKRESLILNFFDILEEAKSIRQELVDLYEESTKNIAIASAVEGSLAVRSASFAITNHPELSVKEKNLMGIIVPEITAENLCVPLDKRGYGLIGTSSYINDAARSFESLVDKIIRAAEIETTMKRLLDEIEKTKRRVNALEFRVIPRLKEMEAFIEFRLEEMERENTFRLKRIKDKCRREASHESYC